VKTTRYTIAKASILALNVLLASIISISGCGPAKARLQVLNDDLEPEYVEDSYRRPALWAKKGHHLIAFIDETKKGGVVYEPHPVKEAFDRFALLTSCLENEAYCELYHETRPASDQDRGFWGGFAQVQFDNTGFRIKSRAHDQPVFIDIKGPQNTFDEVAEKIVREFGFSKDDFREFDCALNTNISIFYDGE